MVPRAELRVRSAGFPAAGPSMRIQVFGVMRRLNGESVTTDQPLADCDTSKTATPCALISFRASSGGRGAGVGPAACRYTCTMFSWLMAIRPRVDEAGSAAPEADRPKYSMPSCWSPERKAKEAPVSLPLLRNAGKDTDSGSPNA